MLEVSEQAFKMLYTELDALTSYPVNRPFVIVDTTGMDKKFRDDIRGIAAKNGYRVMLVTFDYKNISDYLVGVDNEDTINIIKKAVFRYRRYTLPDIRTRDYDAVVRVKDKNGAREAWASLLNSGNAGECTWNVPPDISVAFIGDSHECVTELEELVNKVLERDEHAIIVHMGDYLDKGDNTEAMIRYMDSRADSGDIILHGNHEAYLYRRLKGEIQPAPNEVEEEFFTALKTLQDNEELRSLFFHLFEISIPCGLFSFEGGRTIHATHAPCDKKHIGKYDQASLRAMRNFRVKDRSEDLRVSLDFFYKQAVHNHPLHVTGHFAHSCDKLTYKNKVFLDTGAVYGGSLTALYVKGDNREFIQVKCSRNADEGVDESSSGTEDNKVHPNLTSPLEPERPFNIRDYHLDKTSMWILHTARERGVKYIADTMAPAPSTETELEPIESAFEYYAKRGVGRVVLQPKYMGSRCQMYLYKDPTRASFATSRSGRIIDHVEGLDALLEVWRNKVDTKYTDSWEEVILDGELMPWQALGAGLIDKDFIAYYNIIAWELCCLGKDPGFADLGEFAAEYNVEGRLIDLAKFAESLARHTAVSDLEFKCFTVLSKDGQDCGNDNDPGASFCLFNDDAQCEVDLKEFLSRDAGRRFYNQLTMEEGMEGVVVKPLLLTRTIQAKIDGAARPLPPYMKVRNEEYLRLVYGYDYTRRYDRLVRQKNISFKARLSSIEHALGKDMLFAETQDKRLEAMVKMMGKLKLERGLDPRL
jgi:hypothetical protein